MNLQREIPLRRMMYGGGWHAALDGATFESLNPATGEVIAQVPLGGAADARAAVDAAHAAFPAWSRRTAADRALLIHRVADRLEARREEIAAAITREEGKPLLESRIEMRLTIDSLHWYAEEARRAYGSWIPDPVPNRRLLTMRQPVGVCGAIIPWNVPAAMITRKAGPALATGCTMVLKPAEQTPVTATLIAEAFLEADLPPGVFNVVVGDAPAIGQALLGDERVRKISFTGSTEVGRLLLRGAAEHIKRVSLELGGNAPVILFEDCNLDRAIPALCALKFLNAGQACISANRIYVQSSIHDEVAARIQAHAARLKVGDGLQEGVTMGPLIEPEAVAKLDGMVQEAVADGAALLSGGGRLSDPAHANGFFFAPTVISGMKPGMRMARQEIFGPIAPLFRFDTEAEAVAAANDVPYGLAAYLFTEDMGRAIRVSERLETGMVGVNDIRIGAAEAPFGGVKQSGIGREGGREGMEEYLETKLVALRVDPEA
jgi:succinate-semialdehyde dehydrogenase/glutarate-semialdehyde dehydrogenase